MCNRSSEPVHSWRIHSTELISGLSGKHSPRLEKLAEMLNENAKVLDIGCGFGRNTLFLKKMDFHVVALDIASTPLLSLPAECLKVMATADSALPFRENSFDAIVDSYTFTFIENHKLYVSELSRILKPKGLLLVEFDKEPHIVPHSELKDILYEVFTKIFKVIEIHEIYHAWGCIFDETKKDVPALSAILQPM